MAHVAALLPCSPGCDCRAGIAQVCMLNQPSDMQSPDVADFPKTSPNLRKRRLTSSGNLSRTSGSLPHLAELVSSHLIPFHLAPSRPIPSPLPVLADKGQVQPVRAASPVLPSGHRSPLRACIACVAWPCLSCCGSVAGAGAGAGAGAIVPGRLGLGCG